MLQLVEADTRQVYISVVNPLLSARLAGMMEHGDFTAQVRGDSLFTRQRDKYRAIRWSHGRKPANALSPLSDSCITAVGHPIA